LEDYLKHAENLPEKDDHQISHRRTSKTHSINPGHSHRLHGHALDTKDRLLLIATILNVLVDIQPKMHSKKAYVHLDLSPANILIKKNKKV